MTITITPQDMEAFAHAKRTGEPVSSALAAKLIKVGMSPSDIPMSETDALLVRAEAAYRGSDRAAWCAVHNEAQEVGDRARRAMEQTLLRGKG